jgi:hypothetical protein
MIQDMHHVSWLEQHMLRCPSKKWMLIDCPGCGLQRSVIALLKGEILDSFRIYPPGIMVLATILILILHLIFRFQNGAAILKVFYIVTTVAVLVNYIYKILTNRLL